MLLLAGQDGPLWRHRHHGEFGVGRVVARHNRTIRRLAKALHRGLGIHRGGLCSTVERDGRWGIGGHAGQEHNSEQNKGHRLDGVIRQSEE